MFIRNNTDIDFDALEKEVSLRMSDYQQRMGENDIPAFDPEKLMAHKLSELEQQQDSATTLEQLYRLEDETFVENAFKLFLGRIPAENELRPYLERIRHGERKSQITYELRHSTEGKKVSPNISLGKDGVISQLTSLPIIGKLFNLLIALAGTARLKRLFEARMNHYYRLTKEIKTQINQQNKRLNEQNNIIFEQQFNIETLQNKLNDIQTKLSDSEHGLASTRTRLSLLEQQERTSVAGVVEQQPTNSAKVSSHGVDASFYTAFEEKYRGAQESIRNKLKYYLPILNEAMSTEPLKRGKIIDLGCGRGEWLDLLVSEGYNAEGVDTNIQNITGCEERSLTVYQEDAIGWLSRQKNDSLSCISAFHLIEHLEFELLVVLVEQALRCLAPGGLIIFETPNPENLLVGSNNFYLDPTHIRPLPPTLVEFLLTYKGFANMTIHRLHPTATSIMIPEETEVAKRCNQLFYDAQDYAVVGKKPAA